MPQLLQIVKLPTPSLRERSVEIDASQIGTADLQAFIDDLIQTMFAADGVGIAAPQVGRNIRVFIVNQPGGPEAYINPEITKSSDSTIENEEGCLSVPGVWGIVPRSKRVTVKALNRHGRRVLNDVKGFIATVLQHELDHLDGVLFIDRAIKVVKGEENLKGLL